MYSLLQLHYIQLKLTILLLKYIIGNFQLGITKKLDCSVSKLSELSAEMLDGGISECVDENEHVGFLRCRIF